MATPFFCFSFLNSSFQWVHWLFLRFLRLQEPFFKAKRNSFKIIYDAGKSCKIFWCAQSEFCSFFLKKRFQLPNLDPIRKLLHFLLKIWIFLSFWAFHFWVWSFSYFLNPTGKIAFSCILLRILGFPLNSWVVEFPAPSGLLFTASWIKKLLMSWLGARPSIVWWTRGFLGSSTTGLLLR